MKSMIIYYSQTGNTKKIAGAIHKGMSQLVKRCDIALIKDVGPQDLNKYDLIGLGSPIWHAAPPNVINFINSIPHQQGKHIFSFNTHGALPKFYFPIVVRNLMERGFTVIGMRDWYASVHIQCFPSPYYTDGHPDGIDLKEAEDFGKEMVEVSRRISAGETHLIPSVPSEVPRFEATFPDGGNLHSSGRSPHSAIKYSKEKCTYPKCQICVNNCPMGYIDMSADPPVFGSEKTKCELSCTYCELLCPTGAIYGDDWEWGLKVLYHNKDYFERELDEAEAEGRFRRLVSKEKIGWDTPYYKVHNKRPRFKILK